MIDIETELSDEIVTIRHPETITTKQQLPYFLGVSQESAGTQHLSMNMVVIPAGGKAQAHRHKGFETAIYMLEGRVQTYYGENLEKSVIHQKGDFIFIPPNVPHQPVNLSETENALAIVCRNDPNEQESVELLDMSAV
ncbi:MAG TPA: cupin [Gammaproteobacteria bacterium]|nr:cupin [Gammaproteobacteria bacterium]HBF06947.1 cupin [Gammaproteobacteria bacterium]HCK92594.1 cupin [Gammaproteobacteria bacterium]|tara:strand:+ start:3129 stop:3542 length:414 start_codon:yes stop_codon:yes gene_type:complete